ncbi:hypothetical protein RHGRI_031479 [Rhododendron griersonianum]|uniref:Uncharacterized protein n=1 Tax=Rhododendron griersonianum TaxID=479676 RepID=A0AAV6I8F4_9ERIC|nr:hypothetical protein RHGRI_031479 [Rhododendron griersonianum]
MKAAIVVVVVERERRERRTWGVLRRRSSKVMASVEGKEAGSRGMRGRWWKVMEGVVEETRRR